MLSKCLTPSCPERFLYLHEGEVFKLLVPVPEGSTLLGEGRVEYFWLCRNCARNLTVRLIRGEVRTWPREQRAKGA